MYARANHHWSDSSSSSSGSMDIVGQVPRWSVFPDGSKVRADEYTPKNKTKYQRYILKCAHHTGCTKKRTFAKSETHGRVEPLAYLFVWHLLGANRDVVPPKAEHLKKLPNSEQIAAWVAANGALFEEMFSDS